MKVPAALLSDTAGMALYEGRVPPDRRCLKIDTVVLKPLAVTHSGRFSVCGINATEDRPGRALCSRKRAAPTQPHQKRESGPLLLSCI